MKIGSDSEFWTAVHELDDLIDKEVDGSDRGLTLASAIEDYEATHTVTSPEPAR